MKFFSKKKIEKISLTSENPDTSVDEINIGQERIIEHKKDRPRKAIVKKAGRAGKIFRAGIAIILILSTIISGALIFKGCNDNGDEVGDLTSSIISKLPNFSNLDELESLIASTNGLDSFDYQFLTASSDGVTHNMHISGTATDDGIETNRVLSYNISEGLYQDIEDLKVLVTKIDNNYYFTNDFIECTEEEIGAIENQVITAVEVVPQQIQDLSYEQKLEYIVNHNISLDNNFFMTNLSPRDRYGNLVNFDLDGWVYLKQRTSDGKYKFLKTKWDLSQYVKYDGLGEDPAMVDGKYVFNDNLIYNTDVRSAIATEDIHFMDAKDIIDEYSKVGEHRYSCSLLRIRAIEQIPNKYLDIGDRKEIRDEYER